MANVWPFSWIKRHWQASQRQIDIDVLWPSVRTAADGNLVHAHEAFRLHVALDPAWRDLPEAEREQIIEGLR
jgi:hypothetical protein